MTAEEEVRAAWKSVDTCGGGIAHIRIFTGDGVRSFSTWNLALAFTRQRQQEIAELEEAVERIQDDLSVWPNSHNGLIYQRVLSCLQAILAEKSRGLKGAQ